MTDSQQYLLNLNMEKDEWDILIFMSNIKKWRYISQYFSEKGLNDYVVNRACHFVSGVSLVVSKYAHLVVILIWQSLKHFLLVKTKEWKVLDKEVIAYESKF